MGFLDCHALGVLPGRPADHAEIRLRPFASVNVCHGTSDGLTILCFAGRISLSSQQIHSSNPDKYLISISQAHFASISIVRVSQAGLAFFLHMEDSVRETVQ